MADELDRLSLAIAKQCGWWQPLEGNRLWHKPGCPGSRTCWDQEPCGVWRLPSFRDDAVCWRWLEWVADRRSVVTWTEAPRLALARAVARELGVEE